MGTPVQILSNVWQLPNGIKMRKSKKKAVLFVFELKMKLSKTLSIAFTTLQKKQETTCIS